MNINEMLKVDAVWEKGHPIVGFDARIWRRDDYDSAMKRSEYGNRNSEYGWEIDHRIPNGLNHSVNLRPLNWKNNVAKSDKVLPF